MQCYRIIRFTKKRKKKKREKKGKKEKIFGIYFKRTDREIGVKKNLEN